MEWRVNILRSRRLGSHRKHGVDVECFIFDVYREYRQAAGWKSVRLFLRRGIPPGGPRCRGRQQFPRKWKRSSRRWYTRRAEAIREGVRRKRRGLGQVGDGSSENVNVPINADRAGMTALPGAARSASLRVRWTRFTSPSQSTTRPAANASSWARRVTIQQPRLVRGIERYSP